MTDQDTRLPRTARASRESQRRTGSGWYRISNLAGGPARIDIYDEIGFFGCSAQDFLRDLAATNGPVEVHLNSPGGDPFDAYAIYTALAARPGVTTVVDSLAASAASVIAMAGEQRLMAKYAQLMIHDAWAISDGNATDLRHMADRLDTVSGQIAGLYADTAGGDPGFWREQMRAETWYAPEQALAAGLITGIIAGGRGGTPAPALEPAAASAGAGAIRVSAPPGATRAAAGAMPLGDDGWVQDPDGTVRYDPDGDGDDDSTPEGDTDNSHWDAEGNPLGPIPPCPDMPGMPAGRGTPAVHGAATARHEPITGTHAHPHPAYGSQGGDAMHSHMHEHAGDANHQHAHAPMAPGDDGSQDSAAAAVRAHFGLTPQQVRDMDPAQMAVLAATITAAHGSPQAADVDTSPWDGNAAMTEASGASDPAAAFRSICAGEHNAGGPSQRQHWALPHHKHQGSAPNAAGVRNCLSRLPQTQDLKDIQAAQDHLEAHMRAINPDWEPSSAAAGGMPQAATLPPSAAPAPLAPPGAEPPAAQAAHSRTGPHPGNGRSDKEGPTVTTTISIEDRAARRGEIEARLTAIGTEHGDAEFPPEAQTEWDTLSAELDEHEQVLARHEQGLAGRRARLAAIAARQQGEGVDPAASGYAPEGAEGTPAAGNGHIPPGFRPQNRTGAPALIGGRTGRDIYDLDGLRKRARSAEEMTALCKDNALRAIERAVFPGSPDREKAQGTVERLLARVPDENGTFAKRILVTGSPLYMEAWGRAVAKLSTAGLSDELRNALAVGAGGDGGFAVPFELDPSVLLTSDGAISPIRELARVVQITGKEYDLVTSQGITVTRSAEASAVPDNTPSLAQPTIKAERVTGFIPFSVEIDQDWQAMQSEMMMLLGDAKDVEECRAYTLGTGVAPDASGAVTTLASSSNVNGTGGSGALAAGDLDALENAAAPRFRPRAVWMASKTTFNAYRALLAAQASSAGDDWARPSAGQPMTLRGYPAHENSEMTGAHTTGSKVLLFGDFSRGALVIDRLGMSTELVPHLIDVSTGRPTGQRGILAIWRNNFRPLVDNAFRLLVVA